jgi:hypothetical protein
MKRFAVALVLVVAALVTGAGVLSAAAGGGDTTRQYVGASGPLSGTQSYLLLEQERDPRD